MDALLGDFWNESGYRARRPQTAFIPRLDLYYCGEDAPERAVIKMELPGVDVAADEAQATYEDGLLRIELPVRTQRGARQVPIERAGE